MLKSPRYMESRMEQWRKEISMIFFLFSIKLLFEIIDTVRRVVNDNTLSNLLRTSGEIFVRLKSADIFSCCISSDSSKVAMA